MELEKRGIPVATIGTDEFASLAQMEKEALGMPGMPIVVIPHPVGGLKEAAVRSRAEAAVDYVLQALVTPREELYRIHKDRKFDAPKGMRFRTLFS